jgi:hypothetical protein
MYGADADALDGAAAQLDDAARQLRHTQSALSRSVHSSPWNGRGADQFRQIWDGEYRRGFLDAAAFLEEACTQLRRNADQQRDASAVHDGGGFVGGGGGGGGGGSWDIDGIPELLERIHTMLDIDKHVLEGILKVAAGFVVPVAGYWRNGTYVESYVRWMPGKASTMKLIVGDAASVEAWSKRVKALGHAVSGLDGVIKGWKQWDKDAGMPTDHRAARAAGVGIAHVAVDEGIGEGAKYVGAVAGGLVGGPPGALLGAAVGIGVGWGASKAADYAFDHWHLDDKIADVSDAAYTYVKDHPMEAAERVGEAIVNPGGAIVHGAANLVGHGLKSVFG